MFSEKAKSRLDVVTNVLTIIAAIIFITMVAYNYYPSSKQPSISYVGRSIKLPGFEPSSSSKNVLLVMKKGCRFCEESMDFYRSLIKKNEGNKIKFVGVFPPDDENITEYLGRFGISGLEVNKAEISGIEIDGTPTLIVIDQSGKIAGSWNGKLKPASELEVSALLAQ